MKVLLAFVGLLLACATLAVAQGYEGLDKISLTAGPLSLVLDVAPDGRMTHVHHTPLVLLEAADFPRRLRVLIDGLWTLIDEFRPDEVAIEEVFLARNAMSALKLGQARGAAIAACVSRRRWSGSTAITSCATPSN